MYAPSQSESPPVVDIHRLSRRFGGTIALDGPWIVVGSMLSLESAGRSKPLIRLLSGLAAAFIGVQLISKFALSPAARWPFQHALLAIVGAAVVLLFVLSAQPTADHPCRLCSFFPASSLCRSFPLRRCRSPLPSIGIADP